MAMHVSRAIIYAEDAGLTRRLLNKLFNRYSACPPPGVKDTTPVGFTSMAGLYIIFGVFAGLALLAALVQRAQAATASSGTQLVHAEDTVDALVTDSEILRAILSKVDRLEARPAMPAGASTEAARKASLVVEARLEEIGKDEPMDVLVSAEDVAVNAK